MESASKAASSATDSPSLRTAFVEAIAEGVEGIVTHQRADGAIVYNEKAPSVYPQQGIFPLAFCFAGLGPDQPNLRRHAGSPRVRDAIGKLGNFLVGKVDDKGRYCYDSNGTEVDVVDQRLMHAWTEALLIMRDMNADFPYDKWGDKIQRACRTLIDERLRKLVGVRRFITRITGTGINHVALYISTVYRAGKVLNIPEFVDFALPLGRALAADVHPDGYWDEHSDLLRGGGPTLGYNYLSLNAIALLHAWTGESVFAEAVQRGAAFHGNFCYPHARQVELLDERVRGDHDHTPSVWALHGFSLTPAGRGTALRHFMEWRDAQQPLANASPEALGRLCENYLYWHEGPFAAAPFERRDHSASMTLPGAVYRRGPWFMGLSAMRSFGSEDGPTRENPFSLDRQKLLSVWHEKLGLILDGSLSKYQPENSTFRSLKPVVTDSYKVTDHFPVGGCVGQEDADFVARAVYKAFIGEARLRVLSDSALQVTLTVDPAANQGPFAAGFTLWRRLGDEITTLAGRRLALGDEAFDIGGEELGGGFDFGAVRITGPKEMRIIWPLMPFNSYTSDHKTGPRRWQPRVQVQLTREQPSAVFVISVRSS